MQLIDCGTAPGHLVLHISSTSQNCQSSGFCNNCGIVSYLKQTYFVEFNKSFHNLTQILSALLFPVCLVCLSEQNLICCVMPEVKMKDKKKGRKIPLCTYFHTRHIWEFHLQIMIVGSVPFPYLATAKTKYTHKCFSLILITHYIGGRFQM